MRSVSVFKISEEISRLCVRANTVLRPDVLALLRAAHKKETVPLAKEALSAIIRNAGAALEKSIPICQDTGLPYVFVEMGQGVRVCGGDLNAAINEGVRRGYSEASCRDSVVPDPLSRGKSAFTPAMIHTEIVPSDKVKLTVFPKGFGSENKARLKMFNPTESPEAIGDFIVSVVKDAGADACPPYIIGVGIGGGSDYACLLAKKALLRDARRRSRSRNVRLLEERVMFAVNHLGIGPMGFGGGCSALAVNIETYATHIAGLPVAVNISCHALRSASTFL